MTEENTNFVVLNDNPIENAEQDIFDRNKSAISFVQHVLKLDATKGAVVGVFSPWGYGKTSFFNLARPAFWNAKVPIIEFNPWLFSGTEQLVDRFFNELSAEMGEDSNLKEVGQALMNYGNVLSVTTSSLTKFLGIPLVGELVNALLTDGNRQPQQYESIVKLREKVEVRLKNRKEPIIVVLDDVDRLTEREIREIFKLVRLTASFPNLIYIVLCDRFRVEMALAEQGISGREYLEKIIQFAYDLPEVSRDMLNAQLKLETDRAISCVEGTNQPDDMVMPDVYNEIIHPLIRNMRDVRRYIAAIRETLYCLRGDVATADVLGLEAVRLFLPDVFKLIPSSIDILTVTSTSKSNERIIANQRQLEHEQATGIERLQDKRMKELLTAAKAHHAVAQAFIALLFNTQGYRDGYLEHADSKDAWVGKLLQDRVVAHETILLRYLERVESVELLNFRDAQRALEFLTNSADFEEFIRSLPRERRMDVISSLYSLNNKFQSNQMEPGIVALLNLLPILTEESGVDFKTAREKVERITRLLITNFLKDPSEKRVDTALIDVIERILSAVTSLSSKVVLVNQLEQSSDDELLNVAWIPNRVASHFTEKLCKEIQSKSDEALDKDQKFVMIQEFEKSKCLR